MDELLENLKKYGEVMLWTTSKGSWVAKIEVRLSTTGAKCEVQSNYDCPTAAAAVRQLNERTFKTLNTVSI